MLISTLATLDTLINFTQVLSLQYLLKKNNVIARDIMHYKESWCNSRTSAWFCLECISPGQQTQPLVTYVEVWDTKEGTVQTVRLIPRPKGTVILPMVNISINRPVDDLMQIQCKIGSWLISFYSAVGQERANCQDIFIWSRVLEYLRFIEPFSHIIFYSTCSVVYWLWLQI